MSRSIYGYDPQSRKSTETFDSEWDAFFCDVIDYIVNIEIKEVGLRNYKGATGENQRCSFFTP